MKRTVLLTLLAVAPLCGQMQQTLPSGFLTTFGGSGSAFPFNQTTDHKWHWHYDSSNFTATFPIIITDISVRGLNGAAITNWDFPSVQISMASSPTDYSVAGNGVQPGHDPIFANNLNPDLTIVRPAAPWVGGQTTGGWESLGLSVPFLYDPTLGNDFVIQIEKCGTNVTWGQSIDGVIGAAGAVLGNRYGDTASCSSATSTFQNNEYVPLVRIDYTPAMGLYAGFGWTGDTAGQAIQFTDASYSSSASGILAWSWDFGDGNTSSAQNPSHVYTCQGSYSVTLTVVDGIFPPSTITNTVNVNPGAFTMTTSAPGAGDLIATPPSASCFPNAVAGYTLVSSSGVLGMAGMGPLFGITPDALTFTGVTSPRLVGNPLNFVVAPGFYPDVPLFYGPGTLTFLAGSVLDGVVIYQNAAGGLEYYSSVAQVQL